MKKKYMIAGITCAFLLIAGIVYSCRYHENTNYSVLASDQQETIPSESTEGNIEDKTEVPGTVMKEKETVVEPLQYYVHICGAVKNPGVYQVDENARVCDVITLAGGFCENAAGDYINQAQRVTDGQKIYIPTEKEAEKLSLSEASTAKGAKTDPEQEADTGLININAAERSELMELPGIGEAKAAAIIDYRTANGSFYSKDELMKVSGIKEALYHKIEKYITIE